jgi:hypothetical protein
MARKVTTTSIRVLTSLNSASKRTCPKHKGERLQKKLGKDAEIVIVDFLRLIPLFAGSK